MSKSLKTRVQHKHDTEANWKLAKNFKPLIGEIIIYDADANNPLPRVKIGDGETLVNDLDFVVDAILTDDEIDAICGASLGETNVIISLPDDAELSHDGNGNVVIS